MRFHSVGVFLLWESNLIAAGSCPRWKRSLYPAMAYTVVVRHAGRGKQAVQARLVAFGRQRALSPPPPLIRSSQLGAPK
eukprot:scaffold35472_cov31-Tisochrysis_lutea.AAC.6